MGTAADPSLPEPAIRLPPPPALFQIRFHTRCYTSQTPQVNMILTHIIGLAISWLVVRAPLINCPPDLRKQLIVASTGERALTDWAQGVCSRVTF